MSNEQIVHDTNFLLAVDNSLYLDIDAISSNGIRLVPSDINSPKLEDSNLWNTANIPANSDAQSWVITLTEPIEGPVNKSLLS